LGFGLLTFCNAKFDPAEVVAEAIDLRTRISNADIVITGEGKLDRQTLAGKGPAGVATARAAKACLRSGVTTGDPDVRQLFDDIFTLDDASPDYRETAHSSVPSKRVSISPALTQSAAASDY
jgi:glycerate kinase